MSSSRGGSRTSHSFADQPPTYLQPSTCPPKSTVSPRTPQANSAPTTRNAAAPAVAYIGLIRCSTPVRALLRALAINSCCNCCLRMSASSLRPRDGRSQRLPLLPCPRPLSSQRSRRVLPLPSLVETLNPTDNPSINKLCFNHLLWLPVFLEWLEGCDHGGTLPTNSVHHPTCQRLCGSSIVCPTSTSCALTLIAN